MGLNESDPILGHWDAYWFKMTFFVFFWFFQGFCVFLITKNISNDLFDGAEFGILQINQKFKSWPNLWPLNNQKEINSQNETPKIYIHYWLRIIIENPFWYVFK